MFRFGLFRNRKPETITGVPGKVSNIIPINNSINQQLDLSIRWTKSSMAQSYNVYLGETEIGMSLVSTEQLAKSYNPPGLALDSEYFFRIDSVNTFGTTTGDVMSFSTWHESDIWTDENGIPWTDEYGNYIELGV